MNQQNGMSLAQQKYNMARTNLIVMIAFTLLNMILLVANSGTMMLFSATVPYFALAMGLVDETGLLLVPCIILAVICLLAYLVCWLLSKKHYGWMVAALVMFILDTLALIGMYVLLQDFSGILDLVIHVLVLYYLFTGVKYGAQLQKEQAQPPMPVDPTMPQA